MTDMALQRRSLSVTVRRRQANGAVNEFRLRGDSPVAIARRLASALSLVDRERGIGIWSTADPEVWMEHAFVGRLSGARDIASLARRVEAQLACAR